MEYVLITALGLAVICLLFTVIILSHYLTVARRRADEVGREAEQRVQDALIRLGDDFRRREKEIRADAIKRSKAVVTGKVAEHLVPFTADFGFNPRDIRFLGSPVDFVCFDGLTEGSLDQIVFVEVKSGMSGLSTRERQVRNIVDEGEVSYAIHHVGGEKCSR